MSSISSIYSQSISSLYETSALYKNTSASTTKTTSNTSLPKEDTLTISSEGLSLLQSLLETQSTDTESSDTADSGDNNDFLSQLEELCSSDKLSEDQKSALSDIIEKIKAKLEEYESQTDTIDAENRPMMPPPPKPEGMTTSSDSDQMLPPPMKNDMSTSDDSSDVADTYSSEDEDTSTNPFNLEELVNSGLITQEQSDTIMSALSVITV